MLAAEFWRGNPIQAYVDVFIRIVEPRLILTYIDNDPGFYTISSRFENVTTMFVQNGTRGEVGDVFGYLKPSDRYHVDYMLVHGAAIGLHFNKFVSGNVVPVGSVKNNAIANTGQMAKKTILFFSQFSYRPVGDAPFLFENDGKPISWSDFYEADIQVVSFLDRWCDENGWQLIICGRDFKSHGTEKDFFATYLKSCEWEYIPRSDVYGPYQLIDSAELAVFIDSTLGYEAIARGKRTAALSCRGWPANRYPFRFGWPASMPDSGPFWTNEIDVEEFRRILQYLLTVSGAVWESDRERYTAALMAYDPGNSRLCSITQELLENRK